jgi:hypothetical protein
MFRRMFMLNSLKSSPSNLSIQAHCNWAKGPWIVSWISIHHGLPLCFFDNRSEEFQVWSQHHLKQVSLRKPGQMECNLHLRLDHQDIQQYVWRRDLEARNWRKGSDHCALH